VGYGRAKIIFDNSALPDVNEMVQLEGVDPGWNQVTYAIRKKTKKDKSVYYTLKVNNWISANQGAPKGAPGFDQSDPTPSTEPTVVPAPAPVKPKPAKQQTKPAKGGQSTNVSINTQVAPGGIPNMNVQMEVTETNPVPPDATPTPHVSPSSSDPVPPPIVDLKCVPPASVADIEGALKAESFSENRLEVANTYLANTCLNVDQIAKLAPIFTFEGDRLQFVKAAFDKCVDQNNYWKLNSAFTFSDSKSQLNAFVKRKK
jgi:hypothetical protein